jgi:hypothetical protein
VVPDGPASFVFIVCGYTQRVIFINKKFKKKVAGMFGGNMQKHYLCIRFPKGTARQDDL